MFLIMKQIKKNPLAIKTCHTIEGRDKDRWFALRSSPALNSSEFSDRMSTSAIKLVIDWPLIRT